MGWRPEVFQPVIFILLYLIFEHMPDFIVMVSVSGAWRISLPARGVNRRWFSKIQISRYFKSRTFFPMATGILRIPLEPVYADGLSETVLIFSIISSSQHIVRNRDSLHGSYFSGISGMKEKLPIHHNKTAFFGAAGVQVSIQNMLYILGI